MAKLNKDHGMLYVMSSITACSGPYNKPGINFNVQSHCVF